MLKDIFHSMVDSTRQATIIFNAKQAMTMLLLEGSRFEGCVNIYALFDRILKCKKLSIIY